MNILSTNGIVGRYVTDWSGPGAVLTDVKIRLGAPNYPDDTMTLTGIGHGQGRVGGRRRHGAASRSPSGGPTAWVTTSPARSGCSCLRPGDGRSAR